jgi:hypothetical protein
VNQKRLAATGLLICATAFGGFSFLSQYPPCTGYPDWQSSPYVLPYPAGQTYPIHQANCSLGGHHGAYRYSYDFLIPIGSLVTALHFHVTPCSEPVNCGTLPVTFRNTDPNPTGLHFNRNYTARVVP